MMPHIGGSYSGAAHTTIVPHYRHKRYSTVNEILTATLGNIALAQKKRASRSPLFPILQIPSGLEVKAYTEVSNRLTCGE